MSHSLMIRLGAFNGFTLIELVVTLTVASILAMIAMPAYQQFIASGRLTAATNDFIADASYARVEAMKLGSSQQTGLCASSDGATCTGGSTTWASGWIVFVDADASNTYNTAGGDTILKVHSALPTGITAATTPAGTNTLIFTRLGPMTTAINNLKFSATKSNRDRVVCVSAGTGRVMAANNDNVSTCP